MYDFMIKTKFIKLYNDFSLNYEHLLDSPTFSYMLRHNTMVKVLEDGSEVNTINNIISVRDREQLVES